MDFPRTEFLCRMKRDLSLSELSIYQRCIMPWILAGAGNITVVLTDKFLATFMDLTFWGKKANNSSVNTYREIPLHSSCPISSPSVKYRGAQIQTFHCHADCQPFLVCQSDRWKNYTLSLDFFRNLLYLMILSHFFCDVPICGLYFLWSHLFLGELGLNCVYHIYFINIYSQPVMFLSLVLDSFAIHKFPFFPPH